MTTANPGDQLWTPMEVAYWDWLNASATYTALDLVEYREHRAERPPWDPEDMVWSGDRLPAIWTETTLLGHQPTNTEGSQLRPLWTFTLNILWQIEDPDNPDRGQVEEAISTILVLMLAREARAGMGSGGLIDGAYTVGDAELTPLRTDGDRPRWWHWTLEVELPGRRFTPQIG